MGRLRTEKVGHESGVQLLRSRDPALLCERWPVDHSWEGAVRRHMEKFGFLLGAKLSI